MGEMVASCFDQICTVQAKNFDADFSAAISIFCVSDFLTKPNIWKWVGLGWMDEEWLFPQHILTMAFGTTCWIGEREYGSFIPLIAGGTGQQ